MKIKDRIKNAIGTLIVRYVLSRDTHDNTEGWTVTRRNGSKQIIKVFSLPAYKNIIRPALGRKEEMHEYGITDSFQYGDGTDDTGWQEDCYQTDC